MLSLILSLALTIVYLHRITIVKIALIFIVKQTTFYPLISQFSIKFLNSYNTNAIDLIFIIQSARVMIRAIIALNDIFI